jgi:hypothetical protein
MRIEERLQKIEEEIGQAGNIPEEKRTELLELLAALRTEIAALPSIHDEEAHRIADYAEASALEATSGSGSPKLLEEALSGLTGPVEKFEVSHPELAAVLNRLAAVLANMGM